jgi:hypothetical protein
MIEDSPFRCVRCSKRMVQVIDQDEVANRMRIRHDCWSCGHTFEERRRAPGGTSAAAADRLARLRNA